MSFLTQIIYKWNVSSLNLDLTKLILYSQRQRIRGIEFASKSKNEKREIQGFSL